MSVFGQVFGEAFGQVFGSTSGGGSPPVVVAPTTGATLAAWDRLVEQFKNQPAIRALVDSLVAPVQPVADTVAALLLQQSVDLAVGAQLDVIGKKIGQPRDGLVDATYRRYLRARIATNRSNGTHEDAIAIVGLVLGADSGGLPRLKAENFATLYVDLFGVVPDDATTTALISFLRAAVAAGIRVLLHVFEADPSITFTCASASTQATGTPTADDTSIDVADTSAFPASGSLDVDLGLAVAETVTYTGKLSTSFFGVSALANNHSTGACVQLHGEALRGCGDEADGSVGGLLSEVVQ